MIDFTDKHLYLSARLSHVWNDTMIAAGYQDFCESTTSSNYIGYAYTKDAPEECKELGDALWATLKERFAGTDMNGEEVIVGIWSMSAVSRRYELWKK